MKRFLPFAVLAVLALFSSGFLKQLFIAKDFPNDRKDEITYAAGF